MSVADRTSLRCPSPALLVLAFLFSVGCGGQSCSCLAPIPGGFPAAQRTPNAGQIRLSQTGLAALAADPAALISAATGGGPLEFDVPANCGGNPAVCCPGGNPVSPCGPIQIDLAMQPGDAPRLELRPAQGASRLDVTVRARVKTRMDIPVQIPLVGACGISIDTTRNAPADLKIDVPLNFRQQAMSGTTRLEAGDVVLSQLTAQDVRLTGSLGCQAAGLGLGFFLGTLTSTFSDAIKDAVNGQLCKQCPSGDVAECGSSFATACTDMVCQQGNVCLQEIGTSGRLLGDAVFGGFSPGTTGGIDLYEVTGGYATTDSGGLALGLLGGMVPAGAVRDRCGPPSTPPAPVNIPVSPYFTGNTRPDTGAPYGLGLGIHQHQLDRFAYAAYEGGLLCLTVGTSTVALLTSDTFGLFLPSLSNLAGGTAPMSIGIRPQAPPVIRLGKNTFVDDGMGGQMVGEPLLDLSFTGLELDFFAQIEGQYIRLFTLVADLRLPIGLQVDAMGSITPVLGDVAGAFTNLRVKNSDALTETPAELEAIFPMLLDLALPQLAGGLGSFDVPALGGLQISISDITAVDMNKFLAIYGSLRPAMMRTTPVETSAVVTGLALPATSVFADATRWRRELRPRATLKLGGDQPDLEWSVRVDGGLWSAWSAQPERTVSSERFWLQGKHTLEVAARRRGDPTSADPTPVVLDALFDTIAPTATVEQDGDRVTIGGTDAVSGDAVTVRYRWPGQDWQTALAPVEVEVGGRALGALEIEVLDEAGNAATTRGTSAIARTDFHGAAGAGGCNCGVAASGRDGVGAGLVALLVGLVVGRRRGRGRSLARRLAALGLVLAAGTLPACDCGGQAACGDKDCLPGSLEHGVIGKWNAAARDASRTVFTTYDESLGDLVLGVIPAGGGDPTYSVIDGVPDETPTYDPGTYRGGVAAPGPDVGAYSSVALAGDKIFVAYQDRERKALRFAREVAGGKFALHDVEEPDGDERIGAFASLTARPSGGFALAYLVTGVPTTDGARATELRLAVAGDPAPNSAAAWTISTLASVTTGCAGLCGSGQKCAAPAVDGDPEVCVAPANGCSPTCANDEVCVAGACRATVTAVADTTPAGLGFPTALALPDGRLAVVYYDRERSALVAAVGQPGALAEVVVDDRGDRGMWASAVVDSGGTIHVVYQEARGDQVFYTTLAATPGTPELVDDGQRAGDRPHNVGAGAVIWLAGGTPHVAYQDGLTSDLVTATKSGTSWARTDVATGAMLDGFHLAVPADGGTLLWDALDKASSPPTKLVIRAAP